jgi:hypothetical protein
MFRVEGYAEKECILLTLWEYGGVYDLKPGSQTGC